MIGIDLLSPNAAPSDAPAIDPYLLVAGRGAFVSQRVANRYGLRANSSFTVSQMGGPSCCTSPASCRRIARRSTRA